MCEDEPVETHIHTKELMEWNYTCDWLQDIFLGSFD